MTHACIAVFVPFLGPSPRGSPSDRPLGRLALSLRDEGIELVFCALEQVRIPPAPDTAPDRPASPLSGDRVTVSGLTATHGGWSAAPEVQVDAGYLRTAALHRLAALPDVAALFQAEGAPLVNTPALLGICRDKLAFVTLAQAAGLPVPDADGDPARMLDRLDTWQTAYFKPRYGARGRDVYRLQARNRTVIITSDQGATTMSWEDTGQWLATESAREPRILQRAVPLPKGDVTGLSIRSLVQRNPDGDWVSRPAVLRVTRTGVAGNVSAGASVSPLLASGYRPEGRSPERLAKEIRHHDAVVMQAIDQALGPLAPLVAEVGIDYVPGMNGTSWVIEANDTPQGRLTHVSRRVPEDSALARAWYDAMAAPIRYLARRPDALLRASRLDWHTAKGADQVLRLCRGLPGPSWPNAAG